MELLMSMLGLVLVENGASKKPSEMKEIIRKALEANYMVH